MFILSLFPHYLHSRDVIVCFVHWSLLAITGSGKVFSEEHMLLHVSVFAQPGSGWVASTGECSRSPNLHYCESKQHNGVCSFHPSNGTQASFLLSSIFLCLFERLIYQYHTLKRLLWETSVTDHRWEEERHIQYKLWGLSEMHWGKHTALGTEHFLEGHAVQETDMTRGLWQDVLLGVSFPSPLKQSYHHALGKGLVNQCILDCCRGSMGVGAGKNPHNSKLFCLNPTVEVKFTQRCFLRELRLQFHKRTHSGQAEALCWLWSCCYLSCSFMALDSLCGVRGMTPGAATAACHRGE